MNVMNSTVLLDIALCSQKFSNILKEHKSSNQQEATWEPRGLKVSEMRQHGMDIHACTELKMPLQNISSYTQFSQKT
jgi:hypothetical protein